MFEEVRQELGAVLQQGFLETDSRDFLSKPGLYIFVEVGMGTD